MDIRRVPTIPSATHRNDSSQTLHAPRSNRSIRRQNEPTHSEASLRKASKFHDFPAELLLQILGELPTNGLKAAARTCRKLHELAVDEGLIRERAAACTPRIDVPSVLKPDEKRELTRKIASFQTATWAAPLDFNITKASWLNGSRQANRSTYCPDHVRGTAFLRIELSRTLRRDAGELRNDARRRDWKQYLSNATHRPMQLEGPNSMPLVRSALAVARDHAVALIMYQDEKVRIFHYGDRSLEHRPRLVRTTAMRVGEVRLLRCNRGRRILGAIERTRHWRFHYWPAETNAPKFD